MGILLEARVTGNWGAMIETSTSTVFPSLRLSDRLPQLPIKNVTNPSSISLTTMRLSIAVVALLLASVETFTPSTRQCPSRPSSTLNAQKSRAEFLQEGCVGGLLLLVGGAQQPAQADDDSSSTRRRVAECQVRAGSSKSSGNCVSSSSVKKVDQYVAPWTFEVSASEAQAKLKAVFAADPNIYKDLEEDTNYLKVKAARGLVYDELEFVIDENDKLVKLRSAELSDDAKVSDFGANRRRLDSIRKEAGVFDVMGGMSEYDSIEMRGNGPLGQFKASYGLQSGQGFEDVFD